TAHRCVVPVTSFQERDTVNGSYRMIDFGLPDDTTFYLAGLWTTWTAQRSMAEGVVTTDGYATLTAPPNAEVAPYHERMPVVLLTEEGVKALIAAAAKGDLAAVETELAGDSSLGSASNETGDTPLHQAARNGHLSV